MPGSIGHPVSFAFAFLPRPKKHPRPIVGEGRGEGGGAVGDEGRPPPHRFSRRLTAWLRRLPLKGGVIFGGKVTEGGDIQTLAPGGRGLGEGEETALDSCFRKNPSCRLAACTPRDENGAMDGLKGRTQRSSTRLRLTSNRLRVGFADLVGKGDPGAEPEHRDRAVEERGPEDAGLVLAGRVVRHEREPPALVVRPPELAAEAHDTPIAWRRLA